MVKIDGLDTPVAPGSTVGGCLLVNAIKAEVAERLTKAGQPPQVLSGAARRGGRAGDGTVRSGVRRARAAAGEALRRTWAMILAPVEAQLHCTVWSSRSS